MARNTANEESTILFILQLVLVKKWWFKKGDWRRATTIQRMDEVKYLIPD
jgi:hypothetical protein